MNTMARKKQHRPARPIHADGPAVETRLHVWNRPATDDEFNPIIGKVACTKWTPLDQAYEIDRLGPKGSSEANRRFNAGKVYEYYWDASAPSSADSSQVMNISRSFGAGHGNDNAMDASDMVDAIHKLLGPGNKIIIRMVCGLGCFPSEAVAMVSAEYAKSTWPRFREALDALSETLDFLAKRGHINR